MVTGATFPIEPYVFTFAENASDAKKNIYIRTYVFEKFTAASGSSFLFCFFFFDQSTNKQIRRILRQIGNSRRRNKCGRSKSERICRDRGASVGWGRVFIRRLCETQTKTTRRIFGPKKTILKRDTVKRSTRTAAAAANGTKWSRAVSRCLGNITSF